MQLEKGVGEMGLLQIGRGDCGWGVAGKRTFYDQVVSKNYRLKNITI